MGAMGDFKILTHLNGTHLHLKLVGTLDGVLGSQWIGLLRRYIQKVSTVIIHAGSLGTVLLTQGELNAGLLSLQRRPVRFIFTGEHASLFN
jgi:hypothetical protein